MAQRLQIRRGTASAGASTTLAQGELGYDTDTKQLRVGDGSTAGGKIIGGLADLKGRTAASPSAAGNTDIDPGKPFGDWFVHLTPAAGSGAYTHTISLLTADALEGSSIELLLELPASANPTIEVRNATSGGTLLLTRTGADKNFNARFRFTGSAWILANVNEII